MAGPVSKRRTIHKDENTSNDEQINLELKCKNCLYWYCIDSNKKQTKLNDSRTHEEDNERDGNNQNSDFICSDCSDFARHTTPLHNLYIFIKTNYKPVLLVLLGILILVKTVYYCVSFYHSMFTIPVKMMNRTDTEIWLDNELDRLEMIYYEQDEELWYTFAAGIKSVLRENPHQPSVFLLAFDSEAAGKTAICLAKDVSDLATKYLMHVKKSPVMFHDYDVRDSINDPGELLEIFKNPVESAGSMIISNLHDIEPMFAAQLHYFCDKYSPLVEKAVYFLTLKVDQFRNKRAQIDAEDKLKHLWSERIPKDALPALLTRLTPITLRITSGKSNC